MYLAPSTIHYTNCLDQIPLQELTRDKNILEISRKFLQGGNYPKLQVVKKEGHYFTLNDTKLCLYRHLEEIGQCGAVKVDKVALREVPEGIRKLMQIPERVTVKTNKGQGQTTASGRRRNGKYESIQTSEGRGSAALREGRHADGDSSDDSDDDDEEEEDDEESDSEDSDWSDEEPVNSDGSSDDEDLHGRRAERQRFL